MAKAKKTTGEAAAPKKTASKAKKPAKAAPKAASKAAAGQQTAPMIDTDLAASSAARLLAAKSKLQGMTGSKGASQPQAAEGEKETAAFKQLKGNLNKPASSGLNTALGSTFGHSKSNLPGPVGGKQVAHHQTQGGFNARTNVPRRTNG